MKQPDRTAFDESLRPQPLERLTALVLAQEIAEKAFRRHARNRRDVERIAATGRYDVQEHAEQMTDDVGSLERIEGRAAGRTDDVGHERHRQECRDGCRSGQVGIAEKAAGEEAFRPLQQQTVGGRQQNRAAKRDRSPLREELPARIRDGRHEILTVS